MGKSTLFNRLLEQRKAIVDDISGVTRDRQYGVTDWNGKTFNVIDTGGFVLGSEDVFEKEIAKQVLVQSQSFSPLIKLIRMNGYWKPQNFIVLGLIIFFSLRQLVEVVPENY